MLSPLYGQLSPLRIPTKVRQISTDADANAYLLAVEAADGQELEAGVITAVEAFVVGCKSDGIWSAIKASCILAGARTLSGALVPLVGSAPTNFNFVSADYNRETGLKGNASTKYLNTNRENNADPQNSHHMSVYLSETGTSDTDQFYLNAGNTAATQMVRLRNLNTQLISRGVFCGTFSNATSIGFLGIARTSSTSCRARYNAANVTGLTTASSTPDSTKINCFRRVNSTVGNARISFYSIGEDINLNLFQGRVSTLMSDLAAAIP